FLIIVGQFNSILSPFIILFSVLFSMIGVFLGILGAGSDFVIIMTGLGIISLAGVVVNNAIVLIDYTNLIRQRHRAEKGLSEDDRLPWSELLSSIVEAGKTRLRPVLLTAITTVLGLLPLAYGVNINFYELFNSLDPQFYTGGDNAAFWGPMAWTVIYGLIFATFLTLVIVPVMYLIADRAILQVDRIRKRVA
ncbi:MAG: efflux RND transporter permease subunit, partial [Bacteroidota bacterium]